MKTWLVACAILILCSLGSATRATQSGSAPPNVSHAGAGAGISTPAVPLTAVASDSVGSCCLPNGSCIMTDELDCCELDGYWTYNQSCPRPCSDSGACCLPNGTCVLLTEGDCDNGGGVFAGYDTPCGGGFCAAFPPQPVGSCLLWVRRYPYPAVCVKCLNTYVPGCPPGWQFIPGKTCFDLGKTGACCEPDGECLVESDGDCIAQGGTFMGDGTTCSPAPCAPVPVRLGSWGRIKSIYR